MHDIVRDTPIYQAVLREGSLAKARSMILKAVLVRFPNIIAMMKEQIALIDDPEVFDDLLVKILLAQKSEEVQAYLVELQKKDHA